MTPRGQYLLALLEEDARRARNVMLLKRVRETGRGYVAAPGETAGELGTIRPGTTLRRSRRHARPLARKRRAFRGVLWLGQIGDDLAKKVTIGLEVG